MVISDHNHFRVVFDLKVGTGDSESAVAMNIDLARVLTSVSGLVTSHPYATSALGLAVGWAAITKARDSLNRVKLDR